ncbi:hypothetical protein COT47_02020 [Candidatus Woesearchaeota archaeon CG08_land_8_20_14_0_20_43_7]|nr:MAG: hypothetical protein COT47_02020 [Candidatus Woesearchaeota archaeon CG08_land_8_20_14_0_20_43_7]
MHTTDTGSVYLEQIIEEEKRNRIKHNETKKETEVQIRLSTQPFFRIYDDLDSAWINRHNLAHFITIGVIDKDRYSSFSKIFKQTRKGICYAHHKTMQITGEIGEDLLELPMKFIGLIGKKRHYLALQDNFTSLYSETKRLKTEFIRFQISRDEFGQMNQESRYTLVRCKDRSDLVFKKIRTAYEEFITLEHKIRF